MKKKLSLIIVILVCLLSARQVSAQNEALDSINLQLRQLFSPLARPSPSRLFLYDMAAHITDSVYYQMHCPDTANTDVWFKVYGEMYQSAYDTAAFVHPDALYWRGNSFTGDTIPIGIMDYSFFVLKPEALTTGTYFTFDTVNTHLIDKVVRPGYPYNMSELLIAAPLVQASVFSNPVFRIDPQFILSDMFTYGNFSGSELRIDFGDGHGWVLFDPTVVTHHAVAYNGVTEVAIKVAIFRKKGNEPIASSTSKILTGTTPQIPPDEILHFPGLTVGVYNSCNSTGYSGKTILYLSGFDLLDFIPALNRTPAQIYSQRLAPEKIIALRNLGYNFMVVDWDQSTIDMRFNALYLVNLLDHLKQQMPPDDFEQFVIMGESMGGIIARYALAYMEDVRYDKQNTDLFFSDANDPNNKFYLATHPEIFKLSSSWKSARMHNTRLLITLDTPHQGANLPISLQLAYRHAMNAFGKYIGATIKAAATAFNLMLDSQAAQQMLIYHADTQAGSGFYKTYQRHEDNLSFFGQLQDQLGGYPQYAKVVLMSSGALNGANQRNVFTGGFRTANDRLLDFKARLFARVLWLRVPIFGGNLRALTNPNGQGHVFDAQAGFYGIRIRLKWFGIRIHIGYNSMLFRYDDADVRAYCTAAGGSVGDDTALISSTPSSNGFNLSNNYWLLNLFHYSNTNDGNGCIIFNAHVGLNGFASLNTELSSCTDGTAFNFVPVQSAFDYGNMDTQTLGINIEATNINTKLGMIPQRADAMIGLLWGANEYHAYRREDKIYNLAGTETIYYSCVPTGEEVLRGFLNLEIGDEELYLENNKLPWHAAYSAEYDLHVNDRNPYYEYPGVQAQLGFGGMYSKKDPFAINAPNGLAEFHYDAMNTPTGIGFHFTNPNGNYVQHDVPLDHCCVNLQTGRSANTFEKNTVTKELTPTSLEVYPNPASSASIALKYRFSQSGSVSVQIIGVDGVVRYAEELQTEGTTREVHSVLNLHKTKLAPGLYIIRLSTATETLTSKLMIEN